MQRAAFNWAFQQHGLDWHWDRDMYRARLASSGGRARIAAYGQERGLDVDATAIHETKTARFDDSLRRSPPSPRPGVIESLLAARDMGLATAMVSTTDLRTLTTVLQARDGALGALFDITTSAEDGFAQKPSPEAYQKVCIDLGVEGADAVVVEDNAAGLRAARTVGACVIAYLGANTQDHPTESADFTARSTVFPVVLGAMMAGARQAA